MSAILPSRTLWSERRQPTWALSSLRGTPLLVAVIALLALVLAAHLVWPQSVPLVALVPPCLLASTLCPIREVRIVFGLVLAEAEVGEARRHFGTERRLDNQRAACGMVQLDPAGVQLQP